jgi:phage gpG-like protein
MDNLEKQFADFIKKVDAMLKRLPLLIGNTAKNFFQDRFKTQDWVDYSTVPWARRKAGAKRDKGRAILTDTGRLKRSIRVVRADWGSVQVGTDVPYAAAHNNGFRGAVQVSEHSRIASRKVSTRFGKQGQGLKTGRKKIRGRGHQVRAHIRQVNMPQRRFIGNSHALDIRIDRLIMSELKKL